jgi:hypothetical protein
MMKILKPASLHIGFGPPDADGNHVFTHEEMFIAPTEADGFTAEDLVDFSMDDLMQNTTQLIRSGLGSLSGFDLESSVADGVGRIRYTLKTSRETATDMMVGELLMNSTLGRRTLAELLVGGVAGMIEIATQAFGSALDADLTPPIAPTSEETP